MKSGDVRKKTLRLISTLLSVLVLTLSLAWPSAAQTPIPTEIQYTFPSSDVSAFREAHTRGTAGQWKPDSQGLVGSIPNDEGFSFFFSPASLSRQSFKISSTFTFVQPVDYSGAGVGVFDLPAPGPNFTNLRCELSLRDNNVVVTGWLNSGEGGFPSGLSKPAGKPIKLNTAYTLTLDVQGTTAGCLLDGQPVVSAIIGELAKFPDLLHPALFLIEANARFANFTASGTGGTAAPAPQSGPTGVQVTISAYGKDETDGSDVGWNSPYPNPSFDDDPNRRGLPNARWLGSYYWQGNQLCLAIKSLEAPYPPGNTLAIGYTVNLQGAIFDDGSAAKTFVLYRFSGTPAQKEIAQCYPVRASTSTTPAAPTTVPGPAPAPTPTPAPPSTPAPGGVSGCAQPPTGQVSWYSGDGNANDIQGVNNGILQGGLGFGAGKVGQGFSFTTGGQAVKVAPVASLTLRDSITLEAWVYPVSPAQVGPIVEYNTVGEGYQGALGTHLWLWPTSDTLYANLIDTGGNFHIIQASGIVAAGQFQHVAVTYSKSSGVASLYRNGKSVQQQNLGSFALATNGALNIGWRDAPAFPERTSFRGFIDEVAVYSRALSEGEIQAIYAAGSAGKCKVASPTSSPTTATPAPAPTSTPGVTRSTDTILLAEERTLSPNSTTTVPVRLEKASKLGSLNFSLRYDPSVVKVNKVEAGDLLRGVLFQASTREAGVIRFGIVVQGVEGVGGDGPLAHVEFAAMGSRGSQTQLTLGDLLATDIAGVRLGLNLRSGRVTIQAKLKGDYDGDGKLTAKDALAALKMSVAELPEDLNLDMDNDNRVSAEDARRILTAALEAPPVVSPPAGATVSPGIDRPLETQQATITGSGGGSVVLTGGARVDIPARSIEGEAEVSLVRSEAPNIPGKKDLVSDVYYLTSKGRPLVRGAFALAIPYDRTRLAPGVSEDSLQAFALLDGRILYPTPSRVDTVQQVVVIQNPEVTVTDAPAWLREGLKKTSIPSADVKNWEQQVATSPGTGYVLQAPPVSEAKCKTGAPGEVHEEDGHVFRFLFLVQAPCSFARFASETLMEVFRTYNRVYTDDEGNSPFAHLSPYNRMVVQLGSFPGVNGEYKFMYSWNGYIQIDVAAGLRNQQELRDTLFHEMFHAVQDVYSNMFVGGLAAMWWYEATAEWAGLKGRGLPFSGMVKQEFNTYPYVLSVPIQKSRGYAGGALSYGYALLIDHVERQKPGYLREVLNTWKTTSGQLYNHLVSSGRLEQTYPDFIKDTLLIAASPDATKPWTQAYIFESDTETRIFTRPTSEIGDAGQTSQRLTDDKQRFTDHRFSTTAGPLTTRFFRIQASGVKDPRTVEVSLLNYSNFSNEAWLLTTLPGGAAGPKSPAVRISPQGSSLPGLGKDYGELWVAVFNPDPAREASFNLTVNLKKEARGVLIASGSPIDQPANPFRLQIELRNGGAIMGGPWQVVRTGGTLWNFGRPTPLCAKKETTTITIVGTAQMIGSSAVRAATRADGATSEATATMEVITEEAVNAAEAEIYRNFNKRDPPCNNKTTKNTYSANISSLYANLKVGEAVSLYVDHIIISIAIPSLKIESIGGR